MERKDYYSILGVGQAASQDEIRSAYRALALKYHPDRNKDDPASTARMKQINEAYAVLSDPVKRREYDALKDRYGDLASDRYRQAHSTGDIYRGSDIDQVFAEFARQFGFRSFGEVFREAYGTDFRTFVVRGPGMTGRGFVFYGRPRPTGTPPQVPPPVAGRLSGGLSGGLSGRILKSLLKRATGLELPERGKDLRDSVTVSPEIAREGGEIKYPYTKWGKPRDLMVKIPAGTAEGQQIRLTGMGEPGKGGGEAGDLYLKVKIPVRFLDRVRNFFKKQP